jgi:glycosyltransferase involved in cell wall biosynthesis
MVKLLTIVIPTYNVESYLAQCLDSFLITEVLAEIEILIVDDGSTDHSAEIAQKYVARHPDVYRLLQKENGGHGSTINAGIKAAKGQYFKVVDSDDWVDGQAFKNLVSILRTCQSDVVYSNYYWVDHQTNKKSIEFKRPFKEVIYQQEYQFSQIADRIFLKMHGFTIKTEIVKRIPPIDEHCFYVDMEFVLFPIPFVKTITFIKDFVYLYRIGMSGQSMSSERMKRNAKNYDQVMKRLLRYYRQYQKNKGTPMYLMYMEHVLARMFASRMKIFLSCAYSKRIRQDMQAYDRVIKENYPNVYRAVINKPVRLMRRTNYLLYGPVRAAYYWKERLN